MDSIDITVAPEDIATERLSLRSRKVNENVCNSETDGL